VVGVIGGGQLARMMDEAATGLGLRLRLLAEGADTSAATVVHDVTVGDYTDPATVKAFAAGCDVITFDHEHVPTNLLHELVEAGVAVIAEEYIAFRRELSALVVRSPSAQAVAYPVSESVQRNGVCVETTTPAPGLDDDRTVQIQQLALGIADELGVVGLLAVELMERPVGSVVVNELAMRPHNTGHWSIDGAHTSQFENHLRAVVDLPLGDPAAREPCTVMANVLGGSVTDLPSALLHCFARDRRLRVQLYGKEVKPGRKVGHVTTYGRDLDDVRKRARHAADYLMGEDA
jgi:5-(carboxyamino)imidazole ribonucleotide synthase